MAQCRKEGGLGSELIQVQARMQQVADRQMLPIQKFRDITSKGSMFRQFEIKTKHLRVYLFHDPEKGRIVVSGGKKTTQKKDIVRFEHVVEHYGKEMKNA